MADFIAVTIAERVVVTAAVIAAAITVIVELIIKMSITAIIAVKSTTAAITPATRLLHDRLAGHASSSCGRNRHTIASN